MLSTFKQSQLLDLGGKNNFVLMCILLLTLYVIYLNSPWERNDCVEISLETYYIILIGIPCVVLFIKRYKQSVDQSIFNKDELFAKNDYRIDEFYYNNYVKRRKKME